MKSYLSVRQIVARLNGAISARKIYALVQDGRLRATRALDKLLVEEDSLDELLNGRPTHTSAKELPPPERRPRGRPRKPKMELW